MGEKNGKIQIFLANPLRKANAILFAVAIQIVHHLIFALQFIGLSFVDSNRIFGYFKPVVMIASLLSLSYNLFQGLSLCGGGDYAVFGKED